MKRTYRAGRSSGKSTGLKQRRRRLDARLERAAARQSLEEVIDLGPVQLPLGPEALQAMLSEELHSFAESGVDGDEISWQGSTGLLAEPEGFV